LCLSALIYLFDVVLWAPIVAITGSCWDDGAKSHWTLERPMN
jgi:hypothetical protein